MDNGGHDLNQTTQFSVAPSHNFQGANAAVLQLCGAAALEGVNLVVGPRFASMKKKHGIVPAAERGYQNVYNCIYIYICVCLCVYF